MSDQATATSTPTNDAGDQTKTDVTAAAPEQAPQSKQTTDQTQAPEPQVPEAYEFEMPDGVEVDKAAAADLSALAKELKLDQSTAQKIADAGARMVQRQMEAHAKLVESWVESVKADKDIGGDKLDEHLAVARKAMDTFGSPELKELLNSSGLGNHPAVIKTFWRAGRAISEDKIVTGSPKADGQDLASKLYPSMNN